MPGSLPDELAARFRSLGFGELTEIQRRAIPVICQKRDSLVIAPTGSGKTECSVLPIFSMARKTRRPGRTKVLYVTPLRALNRDVFRRITRYAGAYGLTIAIRHGDTSRAERRRIAQSPPDVLITTPETLVVLLAQKAALEALGELEWVVIDEVHEMLPSKRGSQLSLSLERLQHNASRDITRVGLSATVGDAVLASKFVAGTKRRCRIIRDGALRRHEIEVRRVDGTISDVATAIARYVEGQDTDSPVLLFTNTRGEAEFMAAALREESSVRIELHHGSLSRGVREETESVLRGGGRGIVVCTSSLELGLDIGSIGFVIHYGSPRQVSRMVQRMGRSRHRLGSAARGMVITNHADDGFEAESILERARQGSLEAQRAHDSPADVLAHHLVGLAMQCGQVTVDQARDVFSRAYPFRGVTEGDIMSVLELLERNGIVRIGGGGTAFGMGGRAFRYHFENLSTIPDTLKFRVVDSAGGRFIGTLDQKFVGDHGEPGKVFVLRGTRWSILAVDEKSLTISVEAFRGGASMIPYWEGESIPVDRRTAEMAGALRAGSDPIAPDGRRITVESSRSKGILVIHACFGTRINSTLSALLSSMLSSILGAAVEARSDAYRISLSSTARITEAALRDVLRDEYCLPDVVTASVSGTHNINWKMWCAAKRFGMVAKDAVYSGRLAGFLYRQYAGTPAAGEALRELYHDRYDMRGTEQVLGGIGDGSIQVEWREVADFSKLADPILDHTTRYYPQSDVGDDVLDMVRKRLSETMHRLVCCRCGGWEMAVRTRDVRTLSCPYCRGRQITATFYSDLDLVGIIRKRRAGESLDDEERHRFDRAWKVASLVESFGRTAIVALSGYGVGADTAARILRDMVDEKDLYRRTYLAERQYVMTRGFWD